MIDYCYEFVKNYGAEVDLGGAVNFISGFFGGPKDPFKTAMDEYKYEKSYRKLTTYQKETINKTLDNIFAFSTYCKLYYPESDERINKKMLFGIWKYHNFEFVEFYKTSKSAFAGINVGSIVITALRVVMKNDFKKTNTSWELTSKEIRPIWPSYFPEYEELNNMYYKFDAKFEFELRNAL